MKGLATTSLLIACIALGGMPTSAQAQVKELKLGHTTPNTVAWGAWTVTFAEKVTKGSDGRLKVTVFPSRQLGGDFELYENVRAGTVEIALSGVAQLANFIPSYLAFQLPFLFEDYDQIEAFFTGQYMERRLSDLERLNLKGLAWISTYGRNFVSKTPILTPAHLKGMKVRIEQNRVVEDIIKALQANPVAVNYGEVYIAMQTNVVDVIVFDRLGVAAAKFYEVSKHMSDVSIWPFPGVLVMNLQTWNSLTPDLQKLVKRAAQEEAKHFFRLARNDDQKFDQSLRQRGFEIHQVDVEPFRKLTASVYETYMKDPGVAEIVTEVRKVRGRKP